MGGRFWLAICLCMGVWYVYLAQFPQTPPVQPQSSNSGQTLQPNGTNPTPTTNASNTPDLSAPNQAIGSSQPTGSITSIAPISKLEPGFETQYFKVQFTPYGGKIAQVELPGFHKEVDDSTPLVAPVDPTINAAMFSTVFSDPRLVDLMSGSYTRSNSNQSVVFSKTSAAGVQIKKTYSASEDAYILNAKYEISFPKSLANQNWGTLGVPVGGSGLEYDFNKPVDAWEVATFQNKEVDRKTIDDIESIEVVRGSTDWIAFGNRYFANVLVNKSKMNPDVVYFTDGNFKGGYLQFPLVPNVQTGNVEYEFKIFIGPKYADHLSKIEGLKGLIDYGFFAWLAWPLLATLEFFNGFLHNYGLAIILLTVLVKLLFYPLMQKSMRSMKEMQKLQPKIQEIKEKYKDDKEKLSRAQIELMKSHKVNPMGGCLPMLIQLPVFVALYAVLGNSVELFHAPFFGWIKDLSSADPYYIYPVLMGVSMAIQQKMTPSPGMDPAQQKVMMIMPVVFTFIMLGLPSGLTLYIFISTLLGMVQQYLMKRETNAEMSPQPAAEKG